MLVIILPLMLTMGGSLFRDISALYGPGIMSSIAKPLVKEDVERMYLSRAWLGQTVLIVGAKGAPSDSWLVATRGHMISPDKKGRVYSATKAVSAAVIYAVLDDDAVNLTASSTPGEVFAWWVCASPRDERCSSALTVEKMLAARAGLPSPGCESGVVLPGSSAVTAWEDCMRKLFALPDDVWAAAPFDVFEYGAIGLSLAGRMAVEARRAVPGHAEDE